MFNPFKPNFGYTELAWVILICILFVTIVLSGCVTGYDPCHDPSTRETNMSCMSAEEIEQKWVVTPSGAGQKTKVTLQ